MYLILLICRHCAGFQIDRVLKSFRVNRPTSMVSVPKWDLALVLRVSWWSPTLSFSFRFHYKIWLVGQCFCCCLLAPRQCGDNNAIYSNRMTIRHNAVVPKPYPGYLPKGSQHCWRPGKISPHQCEEFVYASDPVDLVLCRVSGFVWLICWGE